MKLADVEINTASDGRTAEVIVEGLHLENYIAGISYEHKAGEIPVLHLDLNVDSTKIKAENVGCVIPKVAPPLSEKQGDLIRQIIKGDNGPVVKLHVDTTELDMAVAKLNWTVKTINLIQTIAGDKAANALDAVIQKLIDSVAGAAPNSCNLEGIASKLADKIVDEVARAQHETDT